MICMSFGTRDKQCVIKLGACRIVADSSPALSGSVHNYLVLPHDTQYVIVTGQVRMAVCYEEEMLILCRAATKLRERRGNVSVLHCFTLELWVANLHQFVCCDWVTRLSASLSVVVWLFAV